MASTLNRLREIARGTPGSASANAAASQSPATGPRELTYAPVDANGLPVDPRDSFADGVVEAVDGTRVVATAHGACMVIEHRYEGDRSHGRVRVEQCGEIALDETLDVLAGRALRGGRPDRATPRRLVYFDLETTGLSGGAGMVAFLAGVGEWRDDAFVTTQFLMPSFTSEPALLQNLNEYFGDDAVLVTYNGRTFDVPVMEMRGEMQRVPQVVGDLPHLDLLHAARRLWRASEEGDRSCRLTHLEESVLGVGRVGDVGGFEIPGRYFQFVRGGGLAGLEPVLLHNRLDLLSLAALTAHAQRIVRDGRELPPSGSAAFGLGALYERSGWIDAALPCYRAAAEDHWQTRELRRTAARALARLLRRQRRYQEAAAAWQLLLQLGGRPQVLREAREALAIHHEHRGGQLEEARRHAVAGAEQAIGRGERDDFNRRLARLERKLARGAAGMPLWNE
jgi:uncharacterized protein YprB with RNaseH-like and TPR domain